MATEVPALPVLVGLDRLEDPSSPKSRQNHALQHHPAGVGGAQAVPGGLHGNEVRASLPLCSALALRSGLLGTPRLPPPRISCFPCATPSSALALGHPSARKRLFQPQNRGALGFAQLLLLSVGGPVWLHQPPPTQHITTLRALYRRSFARMC